MELIDDCRRMFQQEPNTAVNNVLSRTDSDERNLALIEEQRKRMSRLIQHVATSNRRSEEELHRHLVEVNNSGFK
jgi:hypothetical protein